MGTHARDRLGERQEDVGGVYIAGTATHSTCPRVV